jgi:hypothetical protein
MSEMQTFNSADARHTFRVDGGVYFLPGFSIDDIEPLSALAELSPKEQAAGFREVLASRVACERGAFARFLTGWKSPREAVEALSIQQASDLFKGWAAAAKVTPGESSSSAE